MQQLPTMTLGAVRRRLDCSDATVRRMDNVLAPVRDTTGRRLYDAELVERIAIERERRRAAKAAHQPISAE